MARGLLCFCGGVLPGGEGQSGMDCPQKRWVMPGPLPEKLAVAVTFFFKEGRFQYLRRVCEEFKNFAASVQVHICTNSSETERLVAASSLCNAGNVQYAFHVPNLLGHPYLLTWIHRQVFTELYAQDASITHFLYLEDDTLVLPRNVAYWLRGRELLRKTRQYPSFVRYELRRGDGRAYVVDQAESQCMRALPYLTVSEEYAFINLPNPYQGMYLLDRELMGEFLRSPAVNPDYGVWNIREKAAQGLTFVAVPKGFYSRNLTGYLRKQGLPDPDCLVRHLPANYTHSPQYVAGKVPVEALCLP